MQVFVEGDFGGLVALILGFYLCRLRHLSPSLLLQVEPSVFSKYCQAPTELKRCARHGHWTNLAATPPYGAVDGMGPASAYVMSLPS